MKKYHLHTLALMACMVMTLTPLVAQQNIPHHIKTTVLSLFPNATQMEWEEDTEDRTAYLMDEGNTVEITFDKAGNWMQVSSFLSAENLPETALAYLDRNHPSKDISSVLKIMTKTQSHYYVNFETDTQLVSLTFDETGTLVEKLIEDIDG